METDASLASPSRPFGWICALVGVDPELMTTCPARDRDGVRLLGALMMLVWLWQSVIFAAVAHLMLARPGEIRPELVAGAGLLATIILLLDAYVVMRPSWTGFGYEELRRGGLAIRLPILARVKSGVFLALRLALSAVIGTLVALFVSLILYGKDITGQLAVAHAARNAPVIAAATRLVDGQLARRTSDRADLQARLGANDRNAEKLRERLAERTTPAPSGASADLNRAERARERAEADVARQQRRADRAALAQAQHRLEAATTERDAAWARMIEAQSRAISLAQSRDAVLTEQLTALDAQRRQDLERLVALDAEQQRMLNERPAAIRAAAAADPAYAAADEGLLAHLRALKALTADPWVGTVVLLLEVFFAGIELAAVFSKLLSFVPTTYATRLAREDHLRQVAMAREIAVALDGSEARATSAVQSLLREAPGILTAADLAAPNQPGEDRFGAEDDPDRDAPASPDPDPPHGWQAAPPDRVTPPRVDGTPMPAEAPDADQPRRRRGRPPKAR